MFGSIYIKGGYLFNISRLQFFVETSWDEKKPPVVGLIYIGRLSKIEF